MPLIWRDFMRRTWHTRHVRHSNKFRFASNARFLVECAINQNNLSSSRQWNNEPIKRVPTNNLAKHHNHHIMHSRGRESSAIPEYPVHRLRMCSMKNRFRRINEHAACIPRNTSNFHLIRSCCCCCYRLLWMCGQVQNKTNKLNHQLGICMK